MITILIIAAVWLASALVCVAVWHAAVTSETNDQ